MSMSENFAELFEESLNISPMVPGAVITGTIIRVESDYVVVSAGLKSESIIPIEQFYNERGELEAKVGDDVKVALDTVEDGFGTTRLSRERAKRLESWISLEEAYEKIALKAVSLLKLIKSAHSCQVH
jgi:small subunit ribosomal protein S1